MPSAERPNGRVATDAALVSQTSQPALLIVPVHLRPFLVMALVCHLELAGSRPAPRHIDGVLPVRVARRSPGRSCSTRLCRRFYSQPGLEYPAALVVACLLRPPPASATASGCGMTGSACGWQGSLSWRWVWQCWFATRDKHLIRDGVLGIPALVSFSLSRRPIPFVPAVREPSAAGLFYNGE